MNKPVIPQRPRSKGNGSLLRYMQKLWDFISTLTVKGDGKYIAVDRTALGFMVKLNHSALEIPSPGGGAGGTVAKDTGYFKALDVSTTTEGTTTFKVKIVDGADTEAANCGYYRHGITRVGVPVSSELTLSGSGTIYIKITYTGSAYAFEILNGTLPASVSGTNYVPLWTYQIIDNKLSLRRIQFGDLLTPGVG